MGPSKSRPRGVSDERVTVFSPSDSVRLGCFHSDGFADENENPLIMFDSTKPVNKRVGSVWTTGGRLTPRLLTRRDVLESAKRQSM